MSSEIEEKVDTKMKAYNLIHDPTILLDLIYSKYGDIEEDFNLLYINQLVYDKSSHYNIYYKEYLFSNDPEEYLKRFYKRTETKTRIPKLSDYYKNYHLFFCRPNFKDLVISDLMENYGDDKAEIFYKKNFESTNDDKDSENKNSDSMSSLDNITDNKIIFTKKTKKIIDKNLDPNYGTLTLSNNSNLTGKNTDGLISARSKNDSFEKIVHNLIYYKKNKKIYEKNKNKKVYQIKKDKNNNNMNNKKINKNNNNSTNETNKAEQNKKKINKNMINNLDINNSNNMSNSTKAANNIGKNIRNKNSLFSLLKSNNLINYTKTENNILNTNINKMHNNFKVTINLSKPQNSTNKSQKNKTSISNSNNAIFSSPKITKDHLTTKYEEFHSNIKIKNSPFSHKRNKTEYFNQNNLGSLTNNTQGNITNDTNSKKIKNNYISKILTKKVNSRNYQDNLKNLNLNYRPNAKFNHFFTISNNNLMNKQKMNNGGGIIKNKTFEVDTNINHNDILINQITNLKENLKIYKKNKINHRPNNSNSNNKYLNNKIVIKKNYISGAIGSKFNLVKSPKKLNNINVNTNSNNNINNKKYNGAKKFNNEMNIKISSLNNFNKNAINNNKISNHKKSQSNVLSNFLESSTKNQIYSPVTSTKQFNNKLYNINKSESIVSKMRPKIESNKINNLNINFNNVIFNAPLSNINENINFNNNFINSSNFNANYKLLTPTNNHNNFNNTFSNNNNNFINSITNNNKMSKTNTNLNTHFNKNNISNNSNNNTKQFNTGLCSEKTNYITNLKNFCNFSRNKISSLDKYINNTEDIYSLIKNTSEVNPTKLINSTYEKNNNEIFKKKKRELIISKQNAKKISIKSSNKKDNIQIKKPKKKIEGRNKKFENELGNYGGTQNLYFSRNLGILGHLELIKNINDSFKTREDNKKNYSSTNYLCSSPNNTGRINGVKPINVNRNSNLISKKYIKTKSKIKGK